MSTPIKKMVRPNITKKEPIRNRKINVVSIGETVKFNTKTNNVIGRTEKSTSLNFETITFNAVILSLC